MEEAKGWKMETIVILSTLKKGGGKLLPLNPEFKEVIVFKFYI